MKNIIMGSEKTTPRHILTDIFRWVAAYLLAAVITHFIISIIRLPSRWLILIYVLIYVVLAIALFILIKKKPSWFLGIIVILLVSIGFLLIILSGNEELRRQITWDPSMLGAGVSIIALGITYLTLFYRQPHEEPSRKLDADISELSKKAATLNEEFEKLEDTVPAFLNEFEKLAKRLAKLKKNANAQTLKEE